MIEHISNQSSKPDTSYRTNDNDNAITIYILEMAKDNI